MGKLVTIIGNSGSGKTTLAAHLAALPACRVYLEEHVGRPFQAAFMHDPHYALANQVDYLLFRAGQEQAIRRAAETGVQDGSLDLDFYVFTRLFHQRGDLDEPSFRLCERLYHTLRSLLPPPDLLVYLHAPLEVLAQRKASRQRELDVSLVQDLQVMDLLLQDLIAAFPGTRMLEIDTRAADVPWEVWARDILAQAAS